MSFVIEPEHEAEADKRIDAASAEAFSLSIDCLHDMALQQALFRRLAREAEDEV